MMARPVLSRQPHIIMPCMMKSGSTYLAHAIASHQGLRRVRLTPTWGAREPELCEIRLSRYNHLPYVSQHHLKNSEWTQELIRRYRMTTVVLVRNLFDVTVSLRDHIRRETPVMPIAYFSQDHASLPDPELEAAIADLAIPWFVNFYVGWRQAPNAYFVDYDELIRNPRPILAEIFRRAGIKATSDSIELALSKVQTKNNRQNVGIKGRGNQLSLDVKQRIVQLLQYYPSIQKDEYVANMLAQMKSHQSSK